jgi:hypothetical protein
MTGTWAARHWTGIALVAASLMLAAPLWWVSAPAMPDYPAHLASFALIAAGHTTKFYHLHWSLVPNLASEILVPLVSHITGVVVATKLFLTTSIFLWVLGPGAVHRALYGRTGISPLLGAFFAYNANFIWGFLNYDFSAGLSFFVFAGWIASEKRNERKRIAGFTLAVTALYFCHLFAAAALLVMLAGFELSQNMRLEAGDPRKLLRRAGSVALLYVPSALAFLLFKPASEGDTGVQFNLADTMLDRFESLVLHAFDDPSYVMPIVLLAGLVLALLLRKARLHPAMWLTLALLLAGAVLAPEWAMGGWAVHLRLPAVFAALLFASTEIRLPSKLRYALAAAALVTVGWMATGLAQAWTGYDRQYREFITAIDKLPQGARLLTVLDGDAIGERSDQPYWHMAEFAVPLRGAFTPLLFTTKGQHVVQLNAPYDQYAATTAQQGSPPDIDELSALSRGATAEDEDINDIFPYLIRFQCHFDVAVVVHLDGEQSKIPTMLKLRQAHSFFSLYDIRPDKACAR